MKIYGKNIRYQLNEDDLRKNTDKYFKFLNNAIYSGCWKIISECSAKVYPVICMHINQKKKETYIGYRRIETLADLSRNSVIKAIYELEAIGLIQVRREVGNKGGYVTHHYSIVEKINPPVDFERLNNEEKLKIIKQKFRELVRENMARYKSK